jgi:hypothetical protein
VVGADSCRYSIRNKKVKNTDNPMTTNPEFKKEKEVTVLTRITSR